MEDTAGGRSPASIRATRHAGSSERREAITAPAEPPPTMTKSNCSAIALLPPGDDEGDSGGGCLFPWGVHEMATARARMRLTITTRVTAQRRQWRAAVAHRPGPDHGCQYPASPIAGSTRRQRAGEAVSDWHRRCEAVEPKRWT